MTNSIHYQNKPIPSYSGVTINISNPTLNAGQYPNYVTQNCSSCYPVQNTPSIPVAQNPNLPNLYTQNVLNNNIPQYIPPQYLVPQDLATQQLPHNLLQQSYLTNPIPYQQQNYSMGNSAIHDRSNIEQTRQHPNYPPQYYLNNYNYVQNKDKFGPNSHLPIETNSEQIPNNQKSVNRNYETVPIEEDLTTSENIKKDLDAKLAEQKELEKKGVKTKVVALTNEYIMSLENYLNNPNQEIRLMASKEILTRLDEDKDRYDDAALNALLNKMLQDPDKLIRLAALSAFSSQLASGNEYTFELLNNIQNDPNANKDDIIQVADCLLKMSSTKETKYIPAENIRNKTQIVKHIQVENTKNSSKTQK